jgi:hypothetical protein
MSAEFGPVITEEMILFENEKVFEVVVVQKLLPLSISFLYSTKEEKIFIDYNFMTRNGISLTEKPVDEFIELILENL